MKSTQALSTPFALSIQSFEPVSMEKHILVLKKENQLRRLVSWPLF